MASTDSNNNSCGNIDPPAIDTDDLISFHLAHFQGTYPLGMERLNSEATTNQDNNHNENFNSENDDENDDGLGYYADGTKRTLTDDQIAFLRASELRQIQQQQ